MFQIDEDMTIYVTRGDIAFFSVSAETEGELHKFQKGDVVRIKVFDKKNCANVAFQKDFAVMEECERVNIFLSEEETKIGEVISKHKDYWYEIELNPYTNPQTIIGYDDDGAKIFRLFPEGRDLGNETQPEDIPVVDSELSLTSTRPVENQAVTRGLLEVSKKLYKPTEDVKKAVEDVEKAVEDVNALRNRVNEIIGTSNFNEGVKTYELIHEEDEHIWESTATVVTNGVFAVVHLNRIQSRSSETQNGMVLFELPEELCPLGKTEVYVFDTSTTYICAEEEKCALTFYGNTGEHSHLNRYFFYPLKNAGLPEVSDARVGVDGTVYDTLGEAIREQVNGVSRAVKQIVEDTVLSENTEGELFVGTNIFVGDKLKCHAPTHEGVALVYKTDGSSNTFVIKTGEYMYIDVTEDIDKVLCNQDVTIERICLIELLKYDLEKQVEEYLESYEIPEEKITQAVERYLAEHDEADVKLGQVTLLASAWKGIGTSYSQVVNIEGVTENSKVDLTPSAEQLAEFYEKNLVFVTENDGGVVTVYVVGEKPQVDYTIQLTITEVDYE